MKDNKIKCPIAKPLAGEKLTKKIYKITKKGIKNNNSLNIYSCKR